MIQWDHSSWTRLHVVFDGEIWNLSVVQPKNFVCIELVWNILFEFEHLNGMNIVSITIHKLPRYKNQLQTEALQSGGFPEREIKFDRSKIYSQIANQVISKNLSHRPSATLPNLWYSYRQIDEWCKFSQKKSWYTVSFMSWKEIMCESPDS